MQPQQMSSQMQPDQSRQQVQQQQQSQQQPYLQQQQLPQQQASQQQPYNMQQQQYLQQSSLNQHHVQQQQPLQQQQYMQQPQQLQNQVYPQQQQAMVPYMTPYQYSAYAPQAQPYGTNMYGQTTQLQGAPVQPISYTPSIQGQYDNVRIPQQISSQLSPFAPPYVPSIQGPYDNPGVRTHVGVSMIPVNSRVLKGPSVPAMAQHAVTPAQQATQQMQVLPLQAAAPSQQAMAPGYGYATQGSVMPNSGSHSLLTAAAGKDDFNRKAARSTMDRVAKLMKTNKGDNTAYVGASTGKPANLSYHNDAVFFVDTLAKYLQVEDGGVWGFPQDQLCTDGITRPVADIYTPYRVELFSKLIPSSLATRAMMTPGTVINTYLVNGARCQVPYDQMTITDWSRILVAEAASSPATRRAANKTLDQLVLEPNEAWASASARLMLHFRAAEVHQSRPFVSEDRFFWRFMVEDKLIDSLDRTRKLFLPLHGDFMSMESTVVHYVRHIKNNCAAMQIDYSNPLSQDMETRGRAFKQVHADFVQDLSNRRDTFCRPEELERSQSTVTGKRTQYMSALTHKRPIGGNDLLPARKKAQFSRTSLLGALRDRGFGDNYVDAVTEVLDDFNYTSRSDSDEVVEILPNEAQVAAFNNKAASTPGGTGTPFRARATGSRKAPSRSRLAQASENDATDTPEEEEELPEPSDNKELIYNAIRKRKVCFFHAKGAKCPFKKLPSGCKFSHDDRIIPFGMYRPPDIVYAMTPFASAETDMKRAYGVPASDEGSQQSNADTSQTEEDSA